jgi:hypothetical protein
MWRDPGRRAPRRPHRCALPPSCGFLTRARAHPAWLSCPPGRAARTYTRVVKSSCRLLHFLLTIPNQRERPAAKCLHRPWLPAAGRGPARWTDDEPHRARLRWAHHQARARDVQAPPYPAHRTPHPPMLALTEYLRPRPPSPLVPGFAHFTALEGRAGTTSRHEDRAGTASSPSADAAPPGSPQPASSQQPAGPQGQTATTPGQPTGSKPPSPQPLRLVAAGSSGARGAGARRGLVVAGAPPITSSRDASTRPDRTGSPPLPGETAASATGPPAFPSSAPPESDAAGPPPLPASAR